MPTPHSPNWAAPALVVAIVTALVSINLRGVSSGARVIELLMIVKLLPLLAFVAIGVFFIEPANLAWTDMPPMSMVLSTAGIVIFAFAGIEGSLIPSGEVKSPAKTVPCAAFRAWRGDAAVSRHPVRRAGDSGPGACERSHHTVGECHRNHRGSHRSHCDDRGGRRFNVRLSQCECSVGATRLVCDEGFLPRVLSAVHPRFHTPRIAIMLYGGLVAVIALSGTLEQLAVLSISQR